MALFSLIPILFIGIPLLLIAMAAFWIWMLVDAINRQFENKTLWIILIIILGIIGALLYLFIIKLKAKQEPGQQFQQQSPDSPTSVDVPDTYSQTVPSVLWPRDALSYDAGGQMNDDQIIAPPVATFAFRSGKADEAKVQVTQTSIIIKALAIKAFDIPLTRVRDAKYISGNFGMNPTINVILDNGKHFSFMYFRKKSAEQFMNVVKSKIGR